MIDFSSNDYLGYAKSAVTFKESHQYLIDNNFVQNGATGSRLLSGNHELYIITEQALKNVHHSEVLLFNSGYDANLGFFSTVPQRHDVILYDEFSHASIRDGIRLSSAKSYVFKHNDLSDLKEKLKRYSGNSNLYVVTESVFSMDGDSPDLVQLCQLCKTYKAHVIVDEAHAVGVFNYGLVQQLDLEHDVFARIVTFGKAFGCHGAAVLGSNLLKDFLINFSRPFIYTTGLSPHSLATVKIVYDHFDKDSLSVNTLHDNIHYFKQKCIELDVRKNVIESMSAIQSCIIPGNANVKKCANMMQDHGFNVLPILSPTVPEGQERLRFCIHSYNTPKQIDEVLNLLSTFVHK
ncbi:MAG: aminotransferase class I/II-fold pyridoxal phosphate-dependent enzyme [Flavobacteriaceae bacterium]